MSGSYGREVAITGLGLVTAMGPNADCFWRGLIAGQSMVASPSQALDIDAEMANVCELDLDAPVGQRKQAALMNAIHEALSAAALDALPDGAEVVYIGQAPTGHKSHADDRYWNDFVGPPSMRSTALNPSRTSFLTHACASASFGISYARDLISCGEAPMVLVAGASVLNSYEYASMDVVRAISKSRSRPFDITRDGITLGEGGGAVVLEPVEVASRRGVDVSTTVTGAACRVGSAKAAASDEEAIVDCMLAALAEDGRDHLDYAHAHATGTGQGDGVELAALERVCRALDIKSLPVSSHKGAVGHLLHASSFAGIVATVYSLETGLVPPTAGLTTPVPTDRLKLVGHNHLSRPRSALVNAFGFGGNNSSLVIRRRSGA